jgi:segregation and condensation protein B
MEDLKAIIESLLFVADKPLSVEKLADIIEETDAKEIRATLQDLLNEFNNPGRGFQLREVAGGYQFRTHPECQAYIKRMLKPAPSRLSRAALETLAIIAYKQPIIRSDVEHIRGVDSGGVLRVLMEKKLVRVLGRREIPGRPLIYATTKRFLEVFDLKNLNDLPTPKEIEELTAQEPDLETQPDVDTQLLEAPTTPESAETSDEMEKSAADHEVEAEGGNSNSGAHQQHEQADALRQAAETRAPQEDPEFEEEAPSPREIQTTAPQIAVDEADAVAVADAVEMNAEMASLQPMGPNGKPMGRPMKTTRTIVTETHQKEHPEH